MGGSGTRAISKIGLSGNSFTLKAINFCRRQLDIRQTLVCNLDGRSSNKV